MSAGSEGSKTIIPSQIAQVRATSHWRFENCVTNCAFAPTNFPALSNVSDPYVAIVLLRRVAVIHSRLTEQIDKKSECVAVRVHLS